MDIIESMLLSFLLTLLVCLVLFAGGAFIAVFGWLSLVVVATVGGIWSVCFVLIRKYLGDD